MNVAVVLLAAGSSSRLGRPKQLLTIDNAPLIRVIAERALASRCRSVSVVLGAHGELIRQALNGMNPTLLDNPEWEEGMAASIRCGITWAHQAGADAAILAVCDQPYLSTTHFDRLISAFEQHGDLVASRYNDILGVPALFPESLFSELVKLKGARGAQSVIRSAHSIHALEFPEGALDVDREDDVQKFLSRA